jgi:hypothetical protein
VPLRRRLHARMSRQLPCWSLGSWLLRLLLISTDGPCSSATAKTSANSPAGNSNGTKQTAPPPSPGYLPRSLLPPH